MALTKSRVAFSDLFLNHIYIAYMSYFRPSQRPEHHGLQRGGEAGGGRGAAAQVHGAVRQPAAAARVVRGKQESRGGQN